MSESLESTIESIEDLIAEEAFDDAHAALEAAFDAHGNASELLALQVEMLLDADDLEGCIGAAEVAVATMSDDEPELLARVLSARGYARYYIDELEAARADFNDAIRADGELLPAIVGRAIVHENLNFYNAAKLDLDRAIALDDTVGQPFAVRASILLRWGDLEAATSDLKHAVELDEDDEESRINLARIYSLEGNKAGAMELLEHLIDNGEDPDFVAPGALLRAQLSLTLGSTDAAIEDSEFAAGLIPDLPWAYLQLAASHIHAQVDAGPAIAALKQAQERVDDARDLPDLFALYAAAYRLLGKEEKAAEYEDKVEGTSRLPGYVYGALNPVGNIPINPNKPIDIRALLSELFGEAKNAPEGYEDTLRSIIQQIPQLAAQNPQVGQIQIELPPAPGMVGGKRNLMVQLNKAQ
jgi:tetratricopeptide (TPR) repeat protein